MKAPNSLLGSVAPLLILSTHWNAAHGLLTTSAAPSSTTSPFCRTQPYFATLRGGGGARLRMRRNWNPHKATAVDDGDTTGGGASSRRKTPSAAEVEAAQTDAYEQRLTCATFVALSGILDVVLDGKTIIAGLSESVIPGLNTLWKFSFAYNIWRVSGIYEKINEEKDTAKLQYGIEVILRTMTAVWRQTGIIVTLLVLEDATKALQNRIPFVKELLLSLVGIAVAATLFLSYKETSALSLTEDSNPEETPRQQIVRHGRVTLRAMSLCSAAFLLEAAFLVFIALSQPSWGGRFGQFINIPTPLGLGSLLWGMRLSFGKALKVMTEKTNKDLNITPEATLDLQEATIKFWSKAKSTVKLEVFLKVGSVLVSFLKGG